MGNRPGSWLFLLPYRENIVDVQAGLFGGFLFWRRNHHDDLVGIGPVHPFDASGKPPLIVCRRLGAPHRRDGEQDASFPLRGVLAPVVVSEVLQQRLPHSSLVTRHCAQRAPPSGRGDVAARRQGGVRSSAIPKKRIRSAGLVGADRRAARAKGQFLDVLSESLGLGPPGGRALPESRGKGNAPKTTARTPGVPSFATEPDAPPRRLRGNTLWLATGRRGRYPFRTYENDYCFEVTP